jgi:hypothetical protein
MSASLAKCVIFVSLVCNFLACVFQNETDKIELTEVSPPLLKSKVYQKEDGSLENEDGWLVPDFQVKNKKYSIEDAETEGGKKIKILSSFYFPENEISIQFPLNPAESEVSETRAVVNVTEYKGENQPPFCYLLGTAKKQESYVPFLIKFYLCDMNGDGIFETIPHGIIKMPVPGWVKSN